MSNPSALLLGCAAALTLTGCAGYRLGPVGGLAPGTRSIQVSVFANRTSEPHLAESLVVALRKQIQRDGTYRLASDSEADVVVSGEIIEYNRIELSYQPADAVTVMDYRVTMTAQVRARECATGKVILEKQVQASTLIRAGPDISSAERQALPLLADAMAKNITDLLVHGDWESAP